jgi:lysophospholipase L1-like esterase
VQNLGQNGQDTTGLLTQLRSPGSPRREAVRRADIVLLTIGANDFGDHHDDVVADRCALDRRDSCVDAELHRLRRNMHDLLSTVQALREARPTAVLVTGYWNVFEDGAVARRAFSPAGFRATRTLTFEADTVLREVAGSEGATFVGLYAPFHGPAARGDVTHLLASDGNHPNAAGQALIAQRLLAAGLRGLTGS